MDGTVLFLTSSDEPNATIPGLRDKHPRNPLTLTGSYEVYGTNIISAIVSPIQSQTPSKIGYNNKTKRQEPTVQQSSSFHIELQICSVRNRNNWMLRWNHHAVFIKKTTGGKNIARNAREMGNTTITSTALELSPNKYPPFLFSRVKSYTPRSENILE